MAKEEAPLPEETPPEVSTRKPRGSMFSLIKAVTFVSLIVIVEVVVASMLIPSAQETEQFGRQFVAATEGRSDTGAQEANGAKTSESAADLREVELGIYNITRFDPATNSTRAVDFELYGTVLAADLPEFQRLYDKSQARLREQVIMTLHGAASADLTDAGLGLIKRKILEKTNRALGQPLVREVLFSRFNFVER